MPRILLQSDEQNEVFYTKEMEESLRLVSTALLEKLEEGNGVIIVATDGSLLRLWVEDWEEEEIAQIEAESSKHYGKLN